jgi:Flp pilus assembly protein TadG
MASRLNAVGAGFHDLRRCRKGVAAVEFALAATPLLLLVFGFISINAVFYSLSIMQNSAQYAAMAVASKLVTSNTAGTFAAHSSSGPTACSAGSVTSTTAEYYACTGLPSWATFSVATSENCAGTVPTITVTITANASAAALADIYSIFTGKTLTSTSVAMMQGQCP